MNRDIEIELWKYIKKNCLPQKSDIIYNDDEDLFDTGIIDSAALISFVSFIEEKYDLTISDEDLLPEYFISVHAIAEYIRSKKQIVSLPVSAE